MITSRRSFLGGLLSAPLVAHSGVLMPLRGLVMPYTRWLAAYQISTDQILARYDARLSDPLPMPVGGVMPLTPAQIVRLTERYKGAILEADRRARENPLGQFNVSMNMEYDDKGLDHVNVDRLFNSA